MFAVRARAQFCNIEASTDAQNAWVAMFNEVSGYTLFPTANSWYLGANVPGKPRVFMPYIGGVGKLPAKIDEVASRGYEGFVFGRGGIRLIRVIQVTC